MKTLSILIMCVACLTWLSCDNELITGDSENFIELRASSGKVTGDIEVYWNGSGQHGSDEENSGMHTQRTAHVDLAAFEPSNNKAAKGHFELIIYKNELLEREIKANVVGTLVDSEEARAWFLAEVYFDSKPCMPNGGSQGGGGGEDHEGDEHDGGEHDGDEHDGGPDGHDQGCSGGEDDHGGSGGGQMSGRNCRVGQIVAVEVFDGSSPAAPADEIAWKWFRADAPHLPDIATPEDWPHLCSKSILGGNLTVH